METNPNDNQEYKRVIGLDMHPDVFTAAALEAGPASHARALWVHDRVATLKLRDWACRHLRSSDIVVLEASGNSFEVSHRLHEMGYTCLVLESFQAGAIKSNYCNDDRSSAVKLARVYLSGLAREVWQPDEQTRQMREVMHCHRNAVRDTTRERNRLRSFLNEHCVRIPRGTPLTQKRGMQWALAAKEWTSLQRDILQVKFTQMQEAELRRKRMEQIMVRELVSRPKWARLWRMMGIRHVVAFALMATIGDINRFANPRKLVGYFGLAPGRKQSGNDPLGRTKGIGNNGRADARTLLIQSAQNALSQKTSPLHKWGWKLLLKKNRNMAAAAVARKITVSVWYLLKGFFSPLTEMSAHLIIKLKKIASVLGKQEILQLGFQDNNQFIQKLFDDIALQS
jgi:transposase